MTLSERLRELWERGDLRLDMDAPQDGRFAMTEMETVQRLCRQCGELLHGHDPSVQGAVLAELTSMWLAGHFIPDSPKETERLRNTMFSMHTTTVRDLIPVSEAEILARTKRGSN